MPAGLPPALSTQLPTRRPRDQKPAMASKKNFFLDLLEEAEVARLRRTFTPAWEIAFKLLAASYSVMLLYSVTSNEWNSSTLRGMFIMLVTIMIFLRYPAFSSSPATKPSVVDFLLIVASVLAFGNFILDYDNMAWRAGMPTVRDIAFGIVAIALVLEACRRAMSLILPGLALLLLLFGYFGPYIPEGLFSHQGFSVSHIVGDTYASMNGMFGFVAYVFIAFVMLFIIMGAVLERFGAGTFFIDLPLSLLARTRGGPAKAAVLASCLFGTISGSATANTVATGTFTIPLMKRAGYRPQVAGAIEAAASTGGMFMPPVMGAGAFLMAEMLHMPYAHIVAVALVPALLYFSAIMVMVHFEALKHGIGAVPEEQQVSTLQVLKRGWYHVVPIVVLFTVLFTGGTPSFAAFYAIASFLAVMAIKHVATGDIRGFFVNLFDALAEGGDKSLIIGSTAGPVGIIVGMALLTGVAFKFSALMLSYTFGMQWVALLVVLASTFVLGMGMTVTADYLILATLAVPAMGEMGIPLLAAHLAVFWFSQSSNVTPPVCIAAFAGASIAGAHPYNTGFHAMRFSSFLYLMPFMFVYSPILMPDGLNASVVYCWVVLFLSTVPFAAGITGHLWGPIGPLTRAVLIVTACLLIFPSGVADAIALVAFTVIALPRYLKWRGRHATTDSTPLPDLAAVGQGARGHAGE
ncbi:MAG: TRAP transporter fused permease subunit [Hyphomicrobiaceae bacterium]|nr:TRAP transporter fused permease subunit [Hyphomicrobiaceae bacterium]